ncbi:hypothetical protein [Sphingomonas aliaeris]|uniref:hypothetical protein n=1 Tax=Sphingomonas aliaeris TaxID=2759526 RepID=UPI00298EFFE0|nr:hypothetical protein [Sphingomonas aliaeris]
MADLSGLYDRRRAIGLIGIGGAGIVTVPAWSQALVRLGLPGGNDARATAGDFPARAT